MSAPTAPIWLKHQYHQDASQIEVGEVTPWGTVTAVVVGTWKVRLTVRLTDGSEDTWHLDRGKRVPMMRMFDPAAKDVPSWCIR